MKPKLRTSKKYLLLLTVIILNLFFACDKKIDNPDAGLNDELNFSQSDYESILKNTILYRFEDEISEADKPSRLTRAPDL